MTGPAIAETRSVRAARRMYDAAMPPNTAPKPALHRMPGHCVFDPEVLVAYFVKLMGRAPTAQKIAEVREIFEQQHSAGVRQAD